MDTTTTTHGLIGWYGLCWWYGVLWCGGSESEERARIEDVVVGNTRDT